MVLKEKIMKNKIICMAIPELNAASYTTTEYFVDMIHYHHTKKFSGHPKFLSVQEVLIHLIL